MARTTTVNSDAGVRNGIGAIAFWIRSNDKWLTGSKRLKTKDIPVHEAELSGVLTALHHVSKDEYLRSADFIVVNCDNQGVVTKLKNNSKLPVIYESVYIEILSIIPRSKLRFKWVKGHKNNGKSRHWVNNWCDKELKKHY